MTTTEPYEGQILVPEADYTDFLRTLTVERFTPWERPTSAEDRAEMDARLTVRDGFSFEPIARSVRARKHRRQPNASRRNT